MSRRGVRGALGLLGAALVAIPLAFAAGLYTNGLPQVLPGGPYPNLSVRALIGADTGLASGQSPQTVAAKAFDVAAIAGELVSNQATSTAHAATLNTVGGMVTTEALTTAPGATYTFTLTDSLITATTPLIVAIHNSTNSGGQLAPTSVVVGAGTATLVFTNVGTAALNGTVNIEFHI
jgi:hypothetical protein